LADLLERMERQPDLVEDLAHRGRARIEALDQAEHVARAYLAVLGGTRTPWPASR
jgi:hypothetical protein